MLSNSTRDAKMFALRTGKKWVNSKLIDYCAECDQKFTMLNRKHHCRQCGEVICADCSPDRIMVGESDTLLRICRSCFIEQQKFSTSALLAGESPSSVDQGNSSPEASRHATGDFHCRYEKVKSCFTSTTFHYGPAASQFFVLHTPREVLTTSAANAMQSPLPSCHNHTNPLPKSVPIIVLIHGGFWKVRYGIDNSTIESLVPFFLSKGMAVCQIEYRRVGNHSKEHRDLLAQQDFQRHHSSLSVSPTFMQLFPPNHLMHTHGAPEDAHTKRRPSFEEGAPPRIHTHNYTHSRNSSNSSSGSSRMRAGFLSADHGDGQPPDDEGGYPFTNEDVLQALRLLHHKCTQMNSNASASHTHHYIAANGSRCVSRLAKMDTARTVLLGHSAGGYLALWACCRLQERALPFRPLLCVAVAPVCNLSDAHHKCLGGSAVKNFLHSSLGESCPPTLDPTPCSSLLSEPPHLITDGVQSSATTFSTPSPSELLCTLLQDACPSNLLPIEVPLLLACGTNDSDVPMDMVEDFYWRAKEGAVICPPSLTASPQPLSRKENLSTSSSESPSLIDKTSKLSTTSRNDDLTTAFVRESVSLPVKLLKLTPADHYSPVMAEHPAFLNIYDELFVLAPSLADIPDLDILQHRPDEVRQAMEYGLSSNSNSMNSTSDLKPVLSSSNMEKVLSSMNSLENIAEDGGSSTGDGAASSRTSHSNAGSRQVSHDLRRSRPSRSSLESMGRKSSPPSSSLLDQCLPSCLQQSTLVDTVDLKVENLLSYSSDTDEDGSCISSPQWSHSRKQRANTQDSRDSGDHDRNHHRHHAHGNYYAGDQSRDGCGQHEHHQEHMTVHHEVGRLSGGGQGSRGDTGSTEPHQKHIHDEGGNSHQPAEDMEFFSFPPPVNKSKRRSFIIPKFM